MRPLSTRIEFPGATGAHLAGRLELPVGPARAFAPFAHCFTCSKDSFAAARISRALAERGIAVLRFDFTGLGESGGDFASTNFSSNVADLVAAADLLRQRFQAPRLLIGHSLGGAAVLKAAREVPEAVAVVSLAAPCDPGHLLHLFADRLPEIEQAGVAEVAIAGRRFTISRQFLEDLRAQSMAEAIAGLNRPLLILHDPDDPVVPFENAERIYALARHPKSLVALPGAGHLVRAREDAAYVADLIAAWSARTLGRAVPAEPPVPAGAPTEGGTVTVTETGEGRFAQLVQAGGHLLPADEPISLGGTGTGPSPYQLLLAALGACTAMTVRMYADHKGWPLERVAVRLRHEKVHAEDCAACETPGAKIDRIARELLLDGPLDEAQRQRLLEIAHKCPVHRTLESRPVIVTRLAATPALPETT